MGIEFDKVNPLLLLAIAGMIIFESLLIFKGEDGQTLMIIIGVICYLAGVKTPDFLDGNLLDQYKK